MFGVYKKHRILKISLISLSLILLWFLVSPAVGLIQGQKVTIENAIGTYVYGVDHWVDLITTEYGKMVSNEKTIMFEYTYEKGLFTCTSLEETWNMRYLSNDSIFNCYDNTYLFKKI